MVSVKPCEISCEYSKLFTARKMRPPVMVMSSRREPNLPFVAAARRLHRGEAARHEHERVRHRAAISKYATEVPPLGVGNRRAGCRGPRRRRSRLGRDHPTRATFGVRNVADRRLDVAAVAAARAATSAFLLSNPDCVLCCGAHSAAYSAAGLRQSHVRARERVCWDRDNDRRLDEVGLGGGERDPLERVACHG